MALFTDKDDKRRRVEGTQFFKEKGKHNYLIVYYLTLEAYASLVDWDDSEQVPPMCHTSCSYEWIREDCTPTTYNKLPEAWKQHFQVYLQQILGR